MASDRRKRWHEKYSLLSKNIQESMKYHGGSALNHPNSRQGGMHQDTSLITQAKLQESFRKLIGQNLPWFRAASQSYSTQRYLSFISRRGTSRLRISQRLPNNSQSCSSKHQLAESSPLFLSSHARCAKDPSAKSLTNINQNGMPVALPFDEHVQFNRADVVFLREVVSNH
jgi:hypothetical protein